MSDSEEPQVVQTRFNQAALTRMSQRYGPQMVGLFLQIEQLMIAANSTSFTGNASFLEPGDPVREGELIPSLHFNISPYFPVLSVPIEMEETDVGTIDTVRDGADREE